MANLDFIPSYIDNRDFRCLDIDNNYVGFLSIKSYPKISGFLEVLENFPKNINYDYSIHVKKQDTVKLLKELTYSISSNQIEINDTKKNQIDFDVIDNVTKDAKSLRREIQIENEEIFYVSFIITLYSSNKENLLNLLKEFQSKLYSKSIISNILNFRCLDSYISTLPTNYIDKNLFKTTYKNFTTKNILNIFPFYTKNYIDENGILFGYTHLENKLCYINLFDSKYLNSNVCVFGSSGSGKSYFIKLLIIKNYCNGVNQFIIDPEGEYSEVVSKLSGQEIDFKNNNGKFLNPLEITREDSLKDNYLKSKINQITSFILDMIDIKEEYQYESDLREAIYNSYMNKNITDNIESIYKSQVSASRIYLNKKIIKHESFPTIMDVYENLKDDSLKYKLKTCFIDKFKIFCSHTNIELKNSLTSINIRNLDIKEAVIVLRYFYNMLSMVKKFETSTLIYFDEIWKYINSTAFNLSNEIFSLFKTIRKKNAGIITITQDISDFFNYQNGNYGKSILNNSLFKILFKMDYSDIKVLNSLNLYDEDILLKLGTLDKGNMYINFNYNSSFLNVRTNELEKEILEGE